MNIDKSKKKLIVVMRHGERTDDKNAKEFGSIDQTIMNEFDPALTLNGVEQAKSIGKQLKKFIEKLYNKKTSDLKICIYSSPFLRTLMTAENVIEGFSESVTNPKINLNIYNGLYEYLNEHHFKAHPQETLEVNYDSFTHKYLNKSSITKEDLPGFPENINQIISRYTEAIQKLKQLFLQNENEDDVLVIVTHGYGVQISATYLNIPEDFFFIDYCSTYIFDLESSTGISKYLITLNPQLN
jgi:broad specificity phosphatase PhoE